MKDLCCGWSIEQIAYAKQSSILHSISITEPTIRNLMALKKWWKEKKYPEPMKMEKVCFISENCYEWAAECFSKAI